MGDKSQKSNNLVMQRLGQSGWQAIQRSDFVQAEKAYLKALELARRLADRQAEAVFLSFLGLSRHHQGCLMQAKQDLEACVDIASKEGLSKIEAHAQLMLAEQEQHAGQTEKALQHFLRALEASLDCQDPLASEMAFGNLGLLYLEQGWIEPACECFRQALEFNSSSLNRVVWLGSLGQSLAELGQFEEALELYQVAFKEAQDSHNTAQQSILLGSQGNTFYEQGQYLQAADCYEQALNLCQQSTDDTREGILMGNLGNVYRKLGNLDAAFKACEQALAHARALKDRHSEAAHLDSLADCHVLAGQVHSALPLYEEALAISESLIDHQGQRIYLANLAKAYQKLGQMPPAFGFLERAIALFDEQRARIKSDDLKTSFAVRGHELYQNMVQICLTMGKRIEALEYIGRAKSRAILDLLSNSPIDISELSESSDQSLKKLIARESQLRNQIARLEKLFWLGSQVDDTGTLRGKTLSPANIRKLYSDWRQTIDQLKRRHPNYATLITVDALKFHELKDLWPNPSQTNQATPILLSNTAILEYYLTHELLLGAAFWNTSKQPLVHAVSDPTALETLETDLADFLEMSVTQGWEIPVSLSRRLYNFLLAPLVSQLPKHIDRLILIPHGSLHRLPFSALHNGSEFLIERYALSYLPTTSLIPILSSLTLATKQTLLPQGYLVSAISDYSRTRQSQLSQSTHVRSASGLEDLAYAQEEAQTVFNLGLKHSQAAKLLTNQEVQVSLAEFFGQYPIVHFAGHAVFNPEEPLSSGLVLSDGSILSAASILQGNSLRTHCGKLLVLSACQTGVNVVTAGGELIGLARALMYAGMPNLVLSLWEVADRSTARLMQDFHNAWQAGELSIAYALQQAQKQALQEGQSIHSWAPFIHCGID
ncbi:MAG: CHAT domain-containing protein [Candidatus Melainabacteria bacterium]|nr:CHAT domain-containing protein [Candidatus Melainabacteria bacterium]